MIRTDAEYVQTRARLLEAKERLEDHAATMGEAGLDAAQVKRAVDPLQSFILQLEEEVEAYERTRRGSFEPVKGLTAVGQLLVAARIFSGLSQRQLAERLNVDESQIAHDERNDYRSVSVAQAQRILESIGAVELISTLHPKST